MARYRLQPLGELARQMSFTPTRTRAAQIIAAEQLLHELDPSRGYPLDYVVFRITGYRPKHVATELLTGMALRHDLGLLIEQVSVTLKLPSGAQSEPVLDIDDLSMRLGVTSKTLQRWRRRGLAARRFIFPDGKMRVGFLLSSVERFLANQRDGSAVDVAELSEDQKVCIVRMAQRLATDPRCCRDEMLRRVARRAQCSPLAVLFTLRKHDESLVTRAGRDATDEERSRIVRAFRRGQSIGRLSTELGLARSAVYRAILSERVGRLTRRKVRFIDDPLYHQPDAQQIVETLAAESQTLESAGASTPVPDDLPGPVAQLCRTPVLSLSRERALFLKLNFYKMRFAQFRRRLDPELARSRDLHALDEQLRLAIATRNEIVRANLRLVVSVAKRHLRPSLSLMELISEGTVTLLRAVEAFDVHRGNKFSTYATLALMKGYARAIVEMSQKRTVGADERLASVADRRSSVVAERFLAREQVGDLLRQLDGRERDVLVEHFGLNDRAPATYEQVAQRLGLSRRRIRQIEKAALAKLRAAMHA